ncbi:Fur family zinc uptake transcriptional regulator [Rhizomicrobium palustre]|uniref:Fur family zinc uptake transcriptional regulator n=1 Tax=Rhizomicrobium palustre TaxID=189966 RepID=A0A846N1J6_9PROT|nr:Fur family transcriptional regulator [Rhizomicrobium palustre]NIK89818.1 Fur family zinc uptake transcriptional regulator [Rhizomicrobium palustre]
MARRNSEQAANHETVFAALNASRKPMTAYDLLARLKTKGITAPTTVYRALERLLGEGRVHRLESLNAFIACECADKSHTAMFSICADCGQAEEIASAKLQDDLMALARRSGFKLSHSVVELHGRCKSCAAEAKH